MHIINRVNNGKFTLILGGGPGLDSISKYKESFKNINYIFFNYEDSLRVREYNLTKIKKRKYSRSPILREIKRILIAIEAEELVIDRIIGFSFGSYIGNLLIERIKTIKEAYFGGFLFSFKQLKRVYSREVKNALINIRNNRKNLFYNSSFIDSYIIENLELCNVPGKIEITDFDRFLARYQLAYEANGYWETTKRLNFKRTSEVDYYFYSGSRDYLTPRDNIIEFLVKYKLKKEQYSLTTLDTGHSFSAMIKELDFLK